MYTTLLLLLLCFLLQVMLDLDFKGKDWNSQIKYGQPGFYGELQGTCMLCQPTAAPANRGWGQHVCLPACFVTCDCLSCVFDC